MTPVKKYRGRWHYVRSYELSWADQSQASTLCGLKDVRRRNVARRGADAPTDADCVGCLAKASQNNRIKEFGNYTEGAKSSAAVGAPHVRSRRTRGREEADAFEY